MPEPLTLSRRELAAMIGRSPGWVSRNHARLEALGFPQRLPGLARWPREPVEDWIARRTAQVGVSPGADLREELRQRAEELA